MISFTQWNYYQTKKYAAKNRYVSLINSLKLKVEIIKVEIITNTFTMIVEIITITFCRSNDILYQTVNTLHKTLELYQYLFLEITIYASYPICLNQLRNVKDLPE